MRSPPEEVGLRPDRASSNAGGALGDAKEKPMPDEKFHPSDGCIDDPDVVDPFEEACPDAVHSGDVGSAGGTLMDNVISFAERAQEQARLEASLVSTMPMARSEPSFSKPHRSDDTLVVAVDTRHPDNSVSPDWKKHIWLFVHDRLQQIRRYTSDEYKAGNVLCDQIGFDLSPEYVCWLFGLKVATPDMVRAITKALVNTVIGTVGPINLEPAICMVGTFIHSSPEFASVVEDNVWSLPYGEHTAYWIEQCVPLRPRKA